MITTRGDAAAAGDAITVWRKQRACGNWLHHGRQYRTVLSAADLVIYAKRYGAAPTFVDFRAQTALPVLQERRRRHDRRQQSRDVARALGAEDTGRERIGEATACALLRRARGSGILW